MPEALARFIHACSVLILPVREIVRKLITRLASLRIQGTLSSRHPRCSVARWSSLTAACRVTPSPPVARSADTHIETGSESGGRGRRAKLEQWSGGRAHQSINRLKTLKRQMYGRAGFELLRARALALPPLGSLHQT